MIRNCCCIHSGHNEVIRHRIAGLFLGLFNHFIDELESFALLFQSTLTLHNRSVDERFLNAWIETIPPVCLGRTGLMLLSNMRLRWAGRVCGRGQLDVKVSIACVRADAATSATARRAEIRLTGHCASLRVANAKFLQDLARQTRRWVMTVRIFTVVTVGIVSVDCAVIRTGHRWLNRLTLQDF